jgi:hypothetical protein
MKRILLVALAIMILAAPAMAQRVVTVPIVHDTQYVFQAYPGDSNGTNLSFMGYAGMGCDVITAVPGILSIVPGDRWANFVGAAQAGVAYSIKNVVLRKTTPEIIQCADVFPALNIPQHGTPNIRLWWPLMYEVPGTTWTLTITYGTSIPWDNDGPGPNPPAYVHTEVWSWAVDADLDSLSRALALFHQIPFGLDEVPLISDELLYPELQAMVAAIADYYNASDFVSAGLALAEFEMEVMDACIATSPLYPNPTGPGTGIANSFENPACCKLLADAEYIGFKLGIFAQKK